MKHGVQITTTDDGAWSVSQLTQKQDNGEFHRTGGVIFVDDPKNGTTGRLIDAVKEGLSGNIVGTRSLK